jgi:hypothetical protein
MPGLLDSSPLEFECPECGAKVKTTIGRARRSPTVRCMRGHEIKVEASQFDRELRGVDRAFNDLQRTFRTLGR